ncbi:COG4223 family protein [Neorhizobium galegae]|uniref:COG4223 family protein n=1 Tax=Neorhizobium galegae TaxID=399 RepID=UPI002103F8B2|nr:mitofilin family membrane protein [Neorhizobium galegae]MCQ1853627.1 mitofilin family membrane protein [Neorhizobium galegae]
MVPEQPPRRSKTDKEPVTIDLTAEQSDVVAEPVRSNDTDDAVSATEPAEDVSASAEEPAKAEPTDEPASSPSAADEPRYDDPWSAAARSEPQPATVAPEPEPTPAAPQRPSPATSTLIAAGIFGGIVALLLAGSMQYAGYLPGATPAPAASGLSSEIAALRQEISALKNRPATAAAPDAALANRVAALETAPKASSGAGDQALAALKSDLDRLRATVQSAASADSGLAQRLDQAEAKLNDRGPEQQVARAVAAAALKAGIDRGGPFETELQTFVSVAGDDPAVADLQKFASAGVPARAELQRDFPRIADAMLEATAQPDPNQGIAGRLLASAMSVVKVRRVGDVQGATPDAIVARMEEALRNGNLQASAREWDALPEPAKAVSRDFKQKLDARIQVENLVGGTLTRAVAGTQG